MDAEKMVKEFTDQLKDQKATIVELEKQLETTNNEILQMRGAILMCNEFIEEQKVDDLTPTINDLDKEKDGGQKDK